MANAIEARGLRKRFGKATALDGLDLTVRTGEVHAFLGPNGAGKTTTIRILLGLLRKDGGEVALLGGDPWRDATALHARLAYVPGDVTLWPTPDRRRDHRPAGQAARRRCRQTRGRPQAPRRADRALRARPRQEGARLLQGQPAEGRADRGPGERRGTARARRADLRPRPADGGCLPRLRERRAARRQDRAAVQPHPRRGRGARGPGDHHQVGQDHRDRHARRAAAPQPHHGRGGTRRAGQVSTRCPACTTSRSTGPGSAARWTTPRSTRCCGG